MRSVFACESRVQIFERVEQRGQELNETGKIKRGHSFSPLI